MAATSDGLVLRSGDLELGLAPAIGGSVGFFRRRGVDLMRPLSQADRAAANVLGVAMFPMTPYANRIAGNRFSFEKRAFEVAANNPPERYNVHGTGWRRPWNVAQADSRSARLVLEVAAEGRDPFAYRAEQLFTLAPSTLDVALILRNAGERRLPFGFGLHPWFDREDGVTLRFSAERFYLEGPDGVAGDPVTLPPELDFSPGKPLPAGWRNNDYGAWTGLADLRFPQRNLGLRIEADPVFKHLMLYADPTKPVFCLEPQTNASGALNRGLWDDPREGVIVLAPGEEARGSVRFTPFALQVAAGREESGHSAAAKEAS